MAKALVLQDKTRNLEPDQFETQLRPRSLV